MDAGTDIYNILTSPFTVIAFAFLIGLALGDKFEPLEKGSVLLTKVATKVKEFGKKFTNFFKG